ncbi:MAG: methyltransferase [Proteobacteria bacterium]|nr:methyltransferase [Pseudomonadota bacterium]
MSRTFEEIEKYNLKLYQPSEGYRYNEDSFYLINFIKNLKNSSKIIELCAGVGVIGLCLLKKFPQIKKITFVELQKSMCEIMEENIIINKLTEKTEIINSDYRNINKDLYTSYDVLLANPPYRKPYTGRICKDSLKARSRHEIEGSLKDLVEISSKLLKDKGKLYLIFLSERLNELLLQMNLNNIEPKVIQFIHPKRNSDGKLFIIEGVKKGNPGIKILSPLFIDEYKTL